MLKYRLIAADLDGTLLNSRGQISDYTKKMVDEYHRRGGLFTLATGRAEDSAARYVRELNINAPIIAFNGGKVANINGEVLSEFFLEKELAIKAYNTLNEHKKDMIIYVNGIPYVVEVTDAIQKYINRVKLEMRIINDIGDISNLFIQKILVIDPKMEYDLMRSALVEIFGDELNCVNSDAEFLEILPPNVSKGRGLEILADSLGIPIGQVIAIGDHQNDISMIKTAGLGVAVRNAEPEVLAEADYITSSNDEDGVGLVIKKTIDSEL